MHFVVVKPMGHGSCILGHGSVFVWISGSWVTAYDPLPALVEGTIEYRGAAAVYVQGGSFPDLMPSNLIV